jgi:hypothetical protein
MSDFLHAVADELDAVLGDAVSDFEFSALVESVAAARMTPNRGPLVEHLFE